jgi:alcohol dehydrogenase, propanol-preferring
LAFIIHFTNLVQVVAVGSSVKDFAIGDFAGVKWLHSSCLGCTFCLAGDEPLCPFRVNSGYSVDGSFQQYCVAKAVHAAHIPKDCSLESVAPILCAGITVYKALKECNARPGQDIAVVGAGGGLGHIAMQYAKAMGLRTIGIDFGKEKEDMCLEKLGAAAFVDVETTHNLVRDIMKASADGLGPHAVMIVSSHPDPYRQAFEYVRPRGTIMTVGLPPDALVQAPQFEMVNKMITIRGSAVGNRQDTAEAIEMFRRGLIDVQYKVVGLSKLDKVYELMEQGRIAGRYVLDTSK